MKQRIRKRPMSEINVVPYIDVMLVLLIIFMITAPLLSQGVKVDLPQVSSKPLEQKENPSVIVNIDKDGNFFISYGNDDDDKPQSVEPDVLINRVHTLIKVRAEQGQEIQILVGGDKNVPYGKVVELMSLLQRAGAPTVGLITEQPEN